MQLGLSDQNEALNLQWTGDIKRNESNSRRVNAEVAGFGFSKKFKLINARTVSSLSLPAQTMKYQQLANIYPHLQGLPSGQGAVLSTQNFLLILKNTFKNINKDLLRNLWINP